ncbi:MAG: hypothetical protein HYS26_02095 [Candidatus Kaiserbacteria bacterium]|nr:MAG: hypothetical protein HYS26_02095 [Candidatus Kaiserbacteria bacterium]
MGKIFRKDSVISVTAAVVVAVFLVVATVQAATTISTSISTDGNLTVSGTASTTLFSSNGTAYFGATATTTISSAGVIAAVGDVTVGDDLTVTGTASSTDLIVGNDQVSTISGMIFGACNIASVAVTASSTAYVNCTGATGVTSSYKVFVQATSSFPTQLTIRAASSTATTGTINLLLVNDGITGGNSSGAASINFWAVR